MTNILTARVLGGTVRIFALFVFASILATPVFAADPIVLFDASNIDDESFNKAAHEGLTSFERHNNANVPWLAPAPTAAQAEEDLNAIMLRALKENRNPIIAVGFAFAPILSKVAPANPRTHFVLIDSVVSGANVQSILFREEQGSFMVGVLAAMASKTGKIGFVGGRDSELIRAFGCGFAQGIKHQNASMTLQAEMTGTTGFAFRNPEKGAEITRRLAKNGADIVYHAAGGTGNGVISAAKDLGILAIGVDRNQNSLAPGTVLTSMIKRVDVAVYTALGDAKAGRLKPGIRQIGLEEDGVGWSLDEHNLKLINQDMQARMDDIRFEIMSGQIVIKRYTPATGCPYHDFGPVPAN